MLRAALLLPLLTASTCVFYGEPPPQASGDAEPAPVEEAVVDACFDRVVTELSSDAMEGRGLGSAGLEAAATVIERELAALGMEVESQPFEVQVGVTDTGASTLSVTDGEPTADDDWTPLAFSSTGTFDAELVFAGYGITAPPLEYDDLAGVDLAGKVVLALRFEPGENDEESPFEGRRPTRWSDIRYKAFKAREAGAVALVLVEGPAGAQDDEPERLPNLQAVGPTSTAGLPVVQVRRSVATAWLAAGGLDLAALQAGIDSSYTPATQVVPGVRVSGNVDLEIERATVRNVLGVLPGRGSLADETIVVGAHYDHLGRGGRGSMKPDSDDIHNGADDNASGVAAMICGTAELSEGAEAEPRRALVVAAFAAEEHGLLGSGHYVDHPIRPLEDTVAMVNLDMVGRMVERKLSALGSDSAPQWAGLLEAAATDQELDVQMGGDGYGPSDQMSFYSRGVPVVHLFTGAHADYHSPTDDAETLDMKGGQDIGTFLGRLLGELITTPERLTYVKAEGAPTMGGDSRTSSAWLGSIPDYTAMAEETGGVLLSGVSGGGPADAAGILGGDRIVGFGGVLIDNLYDLTFALRDHNPGDVVEILVLRDGVELRLAATLGDRSKRKTSGPSPHDPHGGGDPHGDAWAPKAGEDASHLLMPEETHLADLRMLTAGGENAEAYFSPDGRKLIFQRTPPEGGCDQQFVIDLETGETIQVSDGLGRTTCGYFDYPVGQEMFYAGTGFADAACPPTPDRSQGYVWPLYDGYDILQIYSAGDKPAFWLPAPGYDAEATSCFVDGRRVFTSVRSGDLELWVATADGEDLTQLTDTPGYDGGAFFTHDCSEIVWRASRPTGQALTDYQALLEQDLVRPTSLELFIMKADGTDVRRLTDNGAANFGPYPLPDASGVLFSSNIGWIDAGKLTRVPEFELYLVGRDGGELEQITHSEGFDGFPMFSPDGRWLAFGSNRGGSEPGETNVFIARWVP